MNDQVSTGLSKTYVALLMLAAALFPINSRLYFISIILASVLWLLSFKANRPLFKQAKINRYFVILALPYLFLVLGMAYTNNMKQGFKELETSSSFIVLPFLILYSNFDEKYIRNIFLSFSLSIVGILAICFRHINKKAALNGHSATDFFSSYLYQTEYLTEPTQIHPTYMSLFISLATLFLILELFRSGKLWIKIIYGVVVVFISVANLLLISRGGLIALGASLFCVAFRSLRAAYRYTLILTVLVITFLAFKYIHGFKRFVEPFESGSELWSGYQPQSSANLHIKSWQCSAEKLLSKKLIFGFGTGEEMDVLYDCYGQKGYVEMITKKLNAHSQYLSTWIKTGLGGLIALLLCFYMSFKISLQQKDMLFFGFLVLIVLASLFESTFNVYRGVVFFSLFNSILLKRALSRQLVPDHENQ